MLLGDREIIMVDHEESEPTHVQLPSTEPENETLCHISPGNAEWAFHDCPNHHVVIFDPGRDL